jgi:hypothetical protein
MCVVSMVMQHRYDEWSERIRWPSIDVLPNTNRPYVPDPVVVRPVTQEEVDEFRRLLERAREYDRKHDEPDCELDEKRRALKTLAKELGADIAFIDEPSRT